MARFFVGALGALFLVVGIIVGPVIGLPVVQKAKASKAWPSVPGKVVESELIRKRDKDGDVTYRADVVYEYSVDGQDFDCDMVWYGGKVSTSDRKTMSKVVADHPVGGDVTVFYDPADPAEAVLMPGAFASSYFLLIFGCVFAVIGGIVVLVAVLAMKPNSNAAVEHRPAKSDGSSRDQFPQFTADVDPFDD